ASGGQRRVILQCVHQLPQRGQYALVSLAQQGGQDVLADLVAPEMITAVAAWKAGGIEVDPVGLFTASDVVPAGAGACRAKPKAALESIEIYPDGVEIDG